MSSLPNLIKLKLLGHNPTPNLEETLSFTQHYRAIEGYTNSGGSSDHPTVSTNLNHIDINHPFVDCQTDGVCVRALVDTGYLLNRLLATLFKV